jgi:hypothetical protein
MMIPSGLGGGVSVSPRMMIPVVKPRIMMPVLVNVDDVVAVVVVEPPPSLPKMMIPAFAKVAPKLRIAVINPVIITFFNIFFSLLFLIFSKPFSF